MLYIAAGVHEVINALFQQSNQEKHGISRCWWLFGGKGEGIMHSLVKEFYLLIHL